MKLYILVLALVAVAWAYPTGEKSDPLPAVPLVIADYSSVVKDSEIHPHKDVPQHDAPQESAESSESSESEESSEAKPAAPKPVEEKPAPASIDSKSSEEQAQPTEAAKPLIEATNEEKKEEEKPVEPIKAEEPIKEDVKPEETKFETKTLAHDDEEVPAPIALPTEAKAEELPKNILEAASQPAAIAEDTIPLTSAKREEPAEEEKEIKKPAIPLLKAEEGHSESAQEKSAETVHEAEGGSEYLRSPVSVAEPETKVEHIAPTAPEHPLVKSAEMHAEKVEHKIEAKSALPEPVPAIEEKHEIVTEEKKEEPKIKIEPAEPIQEGRTVRDAVKEEPIALEETKPIEVEKKDEHIDAPAIKKIEPVAEEVKPIAETKPIAEDVKPIVEEEKPLVKAVPQPKLADPKPASSEESLEASIEAKKEETPVAAEEVPKPLALPSAEETPLLKKETTEEKVEGVIAPAAVAAAEVPQAVY